MKVLLILSAIVLVAFAHHHEPEPPVNGDEFCQKFDPESYCKHWLHIPVCQGLDIPCDGRPICPRYPWSDRRFDVLEGTGDWRGFKYHFAPKTDKVIAKWPVSSELHHDGKGNVRGVMWMQGYRWNVVGVIDKDDNVILTVWHFFRWRRFKGIISIKDKDTEQLEMKLDLIEAVPKSLFDQKLVLQLPKWCIKLLPKTKCPPCSYCKFWQDPMVCHRTDEPCFDLKKIYDEEL
ncbi:hypothetical protein GEMRC1_012601 [Eukaryota sp. GEM-RC1]